VKVVTTIEYSNSWEYERYYSNGVELTPQTCKELFIVWPNEKEECIKIVWKPVSISYYDTGRLYKLERKEMFIPITYNGVNIDLNLKQVLKFVRI
jgi:hypothetical protein